MFFKDNTIRKAVTSVLETRIQSAESAYADNVLEFEAVEADEIAAIKARTAAAKAARAEELAKEVLGQ
jgi:hypothetical protein